MRAPRGDGARPLSARSLAAFSPLSRAEQTLVDGLDQVLPAMETGQLDYWAPDTRTAWGYAGKAYGYVLTLAGWALSLLAVAGFSGIVKAK